MNAIKKHDNPFAPDNQTVFRVFGDDIPFDGASQDDILDAMEGGTAFRLHPRNQGPNLP